MRGTTLTSRSVEKEGQEVLQAPKPRFPCSLWRTPKLEQADASEEAVSPWEARAGTGFLVGLVTLWGTTLWGPPGCA